MAESQEELEYNAEMLRAREAMAKRKAAAAAKPRDPFKSSSTGQPSLTLTPEARDEFMRNYKTDVQPQAPLIPPSVTGGFLPAVTGLAAGVGTQKPSVDMEEEEYNAAAARAQQAMDARKSLDTGGPGAEYAPVGPPLVEGPGKAPPSTLSRVLYKNFGRGDVGFNKLKSVNPELEFSRQQGVEAYQAPGENVWHKLDPTSYNPVSWAMNPGETLRDVGDSAWDLIAGAVEDAQNWAGYKKGGVFRGRIEGAGRAGGAAGAMDVANQAIGNALGYSSGLDEGSVGQSAFFGAALSPLTGGGSVKQVKSEISNLAARANAGDIGALKKIQSLLEQGATESLSKTSKDGTKSLVLPTPIDLREAERRLLANQVGPLKAGASAIISKAGRHPDLVELAKEAPSPEFLKELHATDGMSMPVGDPVTRRELAQWTSKRPDVTGERAVAQAASSVDTMKQIITDKYTTYLTNYPEPFDLKSVAKQLDAEIKKRTFETMTPGEQEVVDLLKEYKKKYFVLANKAVDEVPLVQTNLLNQFGDIPPTPMQNKPPPVSQLVSHQRAFELANQAGAEITARVMTKSSAEGAAQRVLAEVVSDLKDYMYDNVIPPELRKEYAELVAHREILKKYFRDPIRGSVTLSTASGGAPSNKTVMLALAKIDELTKAGEIELGAAQGGGPMHKVGKELVGGHTVGMIERIKQATVDNQLGNAADAAQGAGAMTSTTVTNQAQTAGRAGGAGLGMLVGLEPASAYAVSQAGALLGQRMATPRFLNTKLAAAESVNAGKKKLFDFAEKAVPQPLSGLGNLGGKAVSYGMSKAANPWTLMELLNTRNQSGGNQ